MHYGLLIRHCEFRELLRASAQRNVQLYDRFSGIIHVHRLAKLSIQQRLLGLQYLNIVRLAVVHQLVSAFVGVV